jgi:DNA replication protein DnaC
MNNEATLQKMASMKFYGMSNAFRNILEAGIYKEMSITEVLAHLIDSEYDERFNRKLERLIKDAGFRYKTNINEISYGKSRNMDKDTILNLSDCSWIKRGENVVITGATGVGKSFIACAIGNHACLNKFKVIYLNSIKIFSELKLSKNDGSYEKILRKILKNDLVIFDDFGLHPMDNLSSMILLEILEDRYEKKSVIISSQYPVSSWFELIPDKTYADAICDRIIHKSTKIELKGESLRKKRIIDS